MIVALTLLLLLSSAVLDLLLSLILPVSQITVEPFNLSGLFWLRLLLCRSLASSTFNPFGVFFPVVGVVTYLYCGLCFQCALADTSDGVRLVFYSVLWGLSFLQFKN